MIQYQLPLLSVKDVERSKRFYCGLFGLSVALDLGGNVTFDGGFAIQEDFAGLVSVPGETVVGRSHNMELYFETDDFNGFLLRLEAFGGIESVHPPVRHAWRQRVVRFYDPDGHMIEVGEAMEVVARQVFAEGHSVEETARIIQHPVELVAEWLAEK